MRIDFSGQRLLAVVAHPDDAELLCAGTLARARADGAAIGVCVLCQGDKGQPDPPIEDLVAMRAAEMQAAACLLGAELYAGEFPDGALYDEPATRDRLIEIYRQFQPTLVLAHAPTDYHPDHRATSKIAEAVSWFAASAGHQSASPALAQPPELWWMDCVNMSGFEPEFFIDVSDYINLKKEMLLCHKSQLARGEEQNFSRLEKLMLNQAASRGAEADVLAAEAFRALRAWKRRRAW